MTPVAKWAGRQLGVTVTFLCLSFPTWQAREQPGPQAPPECTSGSSTVLNWKSLPAACCINAPCVLLETLTYHLRSSQLIFTNTGQIQEVNRTKVSKGFVLLQRFACPLPLAQKTWCFLVHLSFSGKDCTFGALRIFDLEFICIKIHWNPICI